VNSARGNDTVAAVDKDTYFWLEDPVVWSDVIGNDEAVKNLLKETNTIHAAAGFYDANKALIHSYFHRGLFSAELAAMLHAPDSELHSSLRTFPTADEFSSDEDPPPKPARATRKKPVKPKPLPDDVSSDEDEAKPPAKSKRPATKRPVKAKAIVDLTDIFSAEESEADDDSFIDNGSYHNLRANNDDENEDDSYVYSDEE
jgi:hypothetical protein